MSKGESNYSALGAEAAEPPLVWADAGGLPEAARQALRQEAQHLAQRLHTRLIWEQPAQKGLALRLDGQGLALGLSGMASAHLLRPDFTRLLPRLQPQRLRAELLVRAAKIRQPLAAAPLAIDATAGLGEDALLLASAGFDVRLCEYNPVIAALLEDALRRAGQDPRLAAICSRMHLYCNDSISYLQQLDAEPDLILLDPMFPPRSKSAKVKKKFQLLQMIEQSCADEEALLQAALAARPRKVVIKRPVKGPALAGIKPDYSLAGKAIRFDCLLPRNEKARDPVQRGPSRFLQID